MKELVSVRELVPRRLSDPAPHAYVSVIKVRKATDDCQLSSSLAAILVEDLAMLPDDSPITRPTPANLFFGETACRYCEKTLATRADLRRHQSNLAGTCQLQNGVAFATYQSLLNHSFDMQDIRENTHLRDIRPDDVAASSGITWFPDVVDDTENDEPVYQGSSIAPSLLYWSSAEKNRFFSAIERHSRHRPDLIAEDVGTKTTSDVLAYKAVLEAGVSLLKDKSLPLSSIPAAREMSQNWITFEESLAEDAIVWEAFTSEASDTPREQRDQAQAAVIDTSKAVHCIRCSRGTCDGVWPVCGSCRVRDSTCTWDNDFHPEGLPEAEEK